jgi:hypothetical protein
VVAAWGLLSFCKAADERTYAVRKKRKVQPQPIEEIFSNSQDDPRLRQKKPTQKHTGTQKPTKKPTQPKKQAQKQNRYRREGGMSQ